MTDELVKRLLSLADCDARSGEPLGKCMREAAERIEQLQAQNLRLSGMCYDLTALDAAVKMLSERDFEYNRKTNDMIERHAEQMKALNDDNARLREALNQSRLAFAGYVSVQSAIDLIDRAAQTTVVTK